MGIGSHGSRSELLSIVELVIPRLPFPLSFVVLLYIFFCLIYYYFIIIIFIFIVHNTLLSNKRITLIIFYCLGAGPVGV